MRKKDLQPNLFIMPPKPDGHADDPALHFAGMAGFVATADEIRGLLGLDRNDRDLPLKIFS